MTPQAFRDLALAMPGVRSKAILQTEVYSVAAKTFATLGWPGEGWAIVKLATTEQARLTRLSRGVTPEPGPRGDTGITLVRLSGVDEAVALEVLTAAWRLTQGAVKRVSGSNEVAVSAGR